MSASKIDLAVKRAADLTLSGAGLTLFSPVLLAAAVGIKLTMPGPVFFRQQRVGRDGVVFDILKLRSMKADREAEAKHDPTKDAERMTPFGKLLRRTKVDELPQLINVFVGDMSLVGPRPTLKEQTDAYNDYQRQRLKMRPGMTGLAQVNGNVTLSWDERIEYDVEYVNNYSLLLDLEILCKTVLVVIFGEEKFRNPKKEAAGI